MIINLRELIDIFKVINLNVMWSLLDFMIGNGDFRFSNWS